MTTDQAPGAVRPTERGAATRTVLLDAARIVFTSRGYAQTGITDIVAQAGASVGSLYHHFSGKADLYESLYEELDSEHAERARAAARRAREAGVSDPMQLFLAGARGYLDVCVERRDLARLFARGDGPPGFDLVWRQRVASWVGKNTEFFARSGEPLDSAVAIVLTGAMMLAVAEMAAAADADLARRIADSVIKVMSRLENATS
ncbi:MAG TPA: TetR/AcrR family transcriptional regulator [Streptosporangiaceae bacterium]|jgi:AcrR family transcriptional regulator